MQKPQHLHLESTGDGDRDDGSRNGDGQHGVDKKITRAFILIPETRPVFIF